MSDELKQAFEQATRDVQSLAERPDNDTLLRLYALYKQATEGDVHGEKPSFFDVVGNAKAARRRYGASAGITVHVVKRGAGAASPSSSRAAPARSRRF